MSDPTTTPPALTPRQMDVLLKHLMGWPNWRIAMSLGYSDESSVAHVLRTDAVQAALRDARSTVVSHASQVVQRLEDGAERALDVVEELMCRADKDSVRLGAANSWLDRAGYRPAQRLEVESRSVSASFNYHTLDESDREALRAIAIRAAKGTMAGDGDA